MEQQLSFRYAESRDTALILRYITELADYEGLKHEVTATEELLEEWLFDKQKAEVIFARENGREIGFALFFHNFSTFLGRGGISLYSAGIPRTGIRKEHYGKTRPYCGGKGLRSSGMVVPRPESTQHRILSLSGSGTDE